MIYVKNDEAAYVSWLDANSNGYVVNMHTLGKNKSLMHRARCMHLYPPEADKVHTVAYPKACSATWKKFGSGFLAAALRLNSARPASPDRIRCIAVPATLHSSSSLLRSQIWVANSAP